VAAAHDLVRAAVPHLAADRPPSPDIATVRELVASGALLSAADEATQ
jgi:histidine ammonia-lyase